MSGLAPLAEPITPPVSFVLEPPPSEPIATEHCCFPIECCACCPSICCSFIPSTFQRIQDCTHGILIMGMLASTVLVASAVFTLVNGNEVCTPDNPWCVASQFGAAPLTLIFAVSVVLYCNRIIRQYDTRMRAKHQNIKKEKENLIKNYQGLLSEMEDLLGKSAESATGLAERSFESKRRDFQRFLERAKQRFGTSIDMELLPHLRRFCMNWLHVFKECAIDPVCHPRMVVTADELMQCQTVSELADLCLERLRSTEVRFVSIQRDQDAKVINQNQANLRRLVVTQAASSRELTFLPMLQPPAMHAMRDPTGPRRGGQRRQSWLKFGSFGLRYRRSTGNSSFPKECLFGCGRLVLLSREHVHLILQFFFGWVLIAFEIFAAVNKISAEPDNDPLHPYYYSGGVVFCLGLTEICISVLLLKFEELDSIQQLEREVKELKRQNVAVETQRQKMGEFWSNAQQLTDLWLYRTVPRLDLFQELHSQLEDGQAEDLVTNIVGANRAMEDLETKLGALEPWRNDGDLSLEEKKAFGREINQLCVYQDFGELVLRIEDVAVGDVLKRITMKALPPKTFNVPRSSGNHDRS